MGMPGEGPRLSNQYETNAQKIFVISKFLNKIDHLVCYLTYLSRDWFVFLEIKGVFYNLRYRILLEKNLQITAIAVTKFGTIASEDALRPRPSRQGQHVPRYYFNIHDGVCLPDAEGMDLPDWQAARLEAIRRAGAVLRDDTQSVALGEDWRIEVTDGSGLILFQMTFLMVEAPVMLRADRGRS